MIVIGANSEVAGAFLEKMLGEGHRFPMVYLFSSDESKAEKWVGHLLAKYQQEAKVIEYDLTQNLNQDVLKSVDADMVFCAAGFLGKSASEGIEDYEDTKRIIDINYAGLVPVLNFFAERMIQKKKGSIIVLSSVAGERGRMSNFIYGSAKAGLTAYLGGLRNLLYHHNIHVLTVKPGFMDTKMTAGMNLNPKLTATPKQAASHIYNAWKKNKNTVYVLPVWQLIMLIIRNIPEFVFKRLKM